MTRFAAVVVLAILGLLMFSFSDENRFRQVSTVFQSLFAERPALSQERFRSQALAEINQLRRQLNLPVLAVDPELEEALGHIAYSQNDLSGLDLNTLFNLLRDLFPGAQYLSATLILNPEEAGLLSDLRRWSDLVNPDYEAVATHVFQDGFQHGCLAVITRRLPSFDLEAANRTGGRFFNQCPRCGKSHAIQLDSQSTTLILSCPDCGRPYEVLAADVAGRFRRAPDFLDGTFRPPARAFARSGHPERLLQEIWDTVLGRCNYEYDTKGLSRGEAWKTPAQTWNDRAGDCEDTAILLTELLISSGIDARVAIGWNIHIGQHAWAVARIGEKQYLLETTTRRRANQTLPTLQPIEKVGNEYRPEQLFDRDRLYFRALGGKKPQPCFDYWTERDWPPLSQMAASTS